MTIWQRHRVAAKQLERRRRPMPHHRVACFLRACRLLPFLCFCPLFHRLRLVTPPCAIGITRVCIHGTVRVTEEQAFFHLRATALP